MVIMRGLYLGWKKKCGKEQKPWIFEEASRCRDRLKAVNEILARID
jgi:hypothetical protein